MGGERPHRWHGDCLSAVVSQELREPHLPVGQVDEVPEFIDVVVTTNTMGRADWVRTKTFAWLTDFLYFDRVLKLPLLLLGSEAGIPLRRLVELFAEGLRRSEARLERNVAQQSAIAALGHSALESLDPQTLMEEAVNAVHRVMAADIVAIAQMDDDERFSHVRAHVGLPAATLASAMANDADIMAIAVSARAPIPSPLAAAC